MRHFDPQSHILNKFLEMQNFKQAFKIKIKMLPRTKRARKNLELTENIASLVRMMSIFFS